ncbi:MAG: phosphatase PAP2 family protein [Deltaproteobacteria bacterium]|nr:phosphatase PAP2 family protein [Deltaproteobacteria bacterium]
MTVIMVLAAVFTARCSSGEGVKEKFGAGLDALARDYRGFYLDTGNLLRFGAGLAGAGVLANTSADREFQEYYRDTFRSDGTDDVSKALKLFGEPVIVLPVLAAVHLVFPNDTPAGVWSQRTLRGIFLGGPLAFAVQYATGGGRPEDGEDSSKWRGPFHGNNGLSGHAFIGALPFITAAKMQENFYLKALLYAASPLAGLSRINDDKHYLSQAALGWYLAYLSASVVERPGPSSGITVSAMPLPGDGLMVFFNKGF